MSDPKKGHKIKKLCARPHGPPHRQPQDWDHESLILLFFHISDLINRSDFRMNLDLWSKNAIKLVIKFCIHIVPFKRVNS